MVARTKNRRAPGPDLVPRWIVRALRTEGQLLALPAELRQTISDTNEYLDAEPSDALVLQLCTHVVEQVEPSSETEEDPGDMQFLQPGDDPPSARHGRVFADLIHWYRVRGAWLVHGNVNDLGLTMNEATDLLGVIAVTDLVTRAA